MNNVFSHIYMAITVPANTLAMNTLKISRSHLCVFVCLCARASLV
jgi:hypothetical protein